MSAGVWRKTRTGRTLSFFFSSRRRHTRLQGDWSSDVCSSDLHRQPNRDLLAPRGSSRQQQSGHIGADNQQKHGHRRHQQLERIGEPLAEDGRTLGERSESHPALDEFPCPVSGGIPENVPVIWHYRRLKGGLTLSLRLLQGESRSEEH